MAANPPSPSRLDLLIALVIAIASITSAVVAWRNSIVSSSSGDANRAGLIDTLKKETATSENIRKLYEEATFAQKYAAYAAELKVLNDSGDPAAQTQAQQLEQYLMPSLAGLAPLVEDPSYRKSDGTFDLDKRLADLNANPPELAQLDPQDAFNRAARYANEQRWLTVDIVLLVAALFWLTVAQVIGSRLRWVTLSIGGFLYLLGVVWFIAVEAIFIMTRGTL